MTEENKETNLKQEENQDIQNTQDSQDTQSEIKEADVVSVTPGLEGPGPGVLQKIANAFKKKPKEDKPEDTVKDKTKDVTDGTVSDKSEQSSEAKSDGLTDDSKGTDKNEPKDDIEYEEIDQRFVDTAIAYGWSNERIVEYAENHDDMDVIEITTRMEKSIKDNRTSNGTVSEGDSFINEEALKTLAEESPEIAQIIKELIDPLAKRFESTSSELSTVKGKLGDYESDRKAQDSARDVEIANGIFDSSGVSALGKTKDIPKYPDGSLDTNDLVVQERQKVWGVAQQFYANGGTFEVAMKNAMSWYHGSNANKDVKHKVIKELREQEERIMPKRQESKVEKEYASEEERKAAIVNDAVRKYNREL